MIKFEKTARGFSRGEFTDHYGMECSIQDSSLASEACIWLGITNAEVKTFNNPPGSGWRVPKLPDGTSIFSRMHLTIPMAKELRTALDRFIENESVMPQNDKEAVIQVATRTCECCEIQFEYKADETFCSEHCEHWNDESTE